MARTQHFAVGLSIWAAVILCIALPATAADMYWTGDGDNNNWYSRHFTGLYDSEHREIYVNNWGQIGIDPPTPGGYDHAILGGEYTAEISWTNNPAIWELTLGAPTTLWVGNGGTLTVNGPSIVNQGVIQIAYGGMAGGGTLAVTNGTVTGGGAIQFVDAGTISGALTLDTDSLIHGSGGHVIASLINRGVINSDVNGGWICLETNAKNNEGLLKASGGGRLAIASEIFQSTAGQIVADDNSYVEYFNNSSVTGGTTTSTGTGLHLVSGGAVTLTDVTNTGRWLAGNGSCVRLGGSTFINDGTFESRVGTMRLDSNITLTGSGDLLLRMGIVDSPSGFTLTNSASHTIHGDGYLWARLDNLGQVIADHSGQTLSLETAAKNNQATIKATGGAILAVKTAITQSATGQISAENGSCVQYYNGSSVTGGTTASTGTGRHLVSGGGVNVTLTDVTNTGRWLAENGSYVHLGGTTFINDGTFEVGGYTGGSGWGTLRLDSNIALTGSGDLLLNPGIVDSPSGFTLTNSASHTIHGHGYLRAGLDNLGQVIADRSGQTLSLETAAKNNQATIKATGGAILAVKTAITQSATGQISAENGSYVQYYNGSSVTGGTTASTGTGRHLVSGGDVNVTLTDVTNTGRWLAENSCVHLGGSTFINDGTFESRLADMLLDSNITLTGSGDLLLNPGIVVSRSGFALTNSPSHTIHGDGYLWARLDNLGQVIADHSGQTLSLETAAKNNQATIKATGGAILAVKTAITQSATGQISAENGSYVQYYNGSSVTGGTTASTGTGRHLVSGGDVNVTLTDVTNTGRWLAENGSIVKLGGGTFTNNGTFEIGGYTGGSGWATGIPADGLILQGTGTLLLTPGCINSPTPVTMTNGAGHTIKGSGGHIYTNVTVNNLGTIEASGGTVELHTAPVQFAGATLSGGTWKATNGTLAIGGSPAVTTNLATVALSGSSSVFAPIDSLADNQGAFSVLGGRTFTTLGTLTNSGMIDVGAGSQLAVKGGYTQTAGLTSVDGILSATEALVFSGGELAGTGTISGRTIVNAGGVLSPGHSAGVLTFQRLTLNDGAAYDFEIDGPSADRIDIIGTGDAFTLAAGGTFTINLSAINPTGALSEYTLFHWTGDDPIFAGTTWLVTGAPGMSGQIEFRPDTNSLVLTNVVVPEPLSISLLVMAIGGLVARRRHGW